MEWRVSQALPNILHLDLNSCFATAEQQASPLLRGKPVVVAAYDSPGGCVLSPSIEAKKLGIKTGMRVWQARDICHSVIVRLPDPPKYRDINKKFVRILQDYSPKVVVKSIDEAVLELPISGGKCCLEDVRTTSGHGFPSEVEGRARRSKKPEPTLGARSWSLDNISPHHQELAFIAGQIKQRLRQEIGEWISCNIGVGTNRFLAKLASDLHKPDGFDIIDHTNIREVFGSIELTDLCGISFGFKKRLNQEGIFTALEFLDASLDTLQKRVFKGIGGYYWHLRLHGFEIDNIEQKQKSFGQSYALPKPVINQSEVDKILMKLCEKMGRRLRASGFCAEGIWIGCLYDNYSSYNHGELVKTRLFTTGELFDFAKKILAKQPRALPISKLAISCFNLQKADRGQAELFATDKDRQWRASSALDSINNRYGEYTIASALMFNTGNMAIDRIAFGK